MKLPSVASREFWRAYRRLPRDVRKAATRAYRLWQQDAFHPSLHFKKVGGTSWSVRVGFHHRCAKRKPMQGRGAKPSGKKVTATVLFGTGFAPPRSRLA